MVELTEVKDETSAAPQQVPAEPLASNDGVVANSNAARDDNDDDDSESDSDFDDDFDEDETFLERIAALRDIIPPKQRQAASNFFGTAVSVFRTVFSAGTSLTWAITTSALLLGVPLSMSILAEQQLIEMEKTFDLQKDAGDLLGQNANKPSMASS